MLKILIFVITKNLFHWSHICNIKKHIWRADIMLTEKCTLNCTFCNMYMPHFKQAKHRDLEEIKDDFDKFFSLTDYVSIFHLVGGEPLMYPQVNEVIRICR